MVSETTDTMDVGTALLELEHHSSHTVIRLLGDHDCTTASDLLREIEQVVGRGDVILNLDETSFIDSAILHGIVRGQRVARGAGRTLSISITRAHPLRRVLEMTNLGVEIRESVNEIGQRENGSASSVNGGASSVNGGASSVNGGASS